MQRRCIFSQIYSRNWRADARGNRQYRRLRSHPLKALSNPVITGLLKKKDISIVVQHMASLADIDAIKIGNQTTTAEVMSDAMCHLSNIFTKHTLNTWIVCTKWIHFIQPPICFQSVCNG